MSLGLSPRAVELTCAMTLHRLIHPDSENAMPNWIRSTALGDLLGIDFEALGEDSLYENLDLLEQRVGLSPGSTIVMDRGMALDKNFAMLRERGLHYVIAGRQAERDQWLDEFEDLDGGYLLRSDRHDLAAAEAWLIYITLTRAEAAFRAMKSPLAERPIFHHLERRVDTHIFLCVLAYHLLVAIETTLLDNGVHTSWATVRETLATHQIATVVLPADDGQVLRIRRATKPEPKHEELYRLLDVPNEPLRPIKTWSTEETEPANPKPSD
jgi:hypothetical protein